ncbi:MAG: hypothetical protein EHM31_06725 [Candidatus Aminicenantes bacterium]|nr:MAG: hypothetical protein EHM31_06725 [Candidatus Aminicenantes bacterium]
MKKCLCLLAAALVGLTLLSGITGAWERGTHAYIADALKKAGGPYNIDEMYGSMAPDVFNYMFSPPYVLFRNYLYDQTHHQFSLVRDAVKWGYEKSSAYGFLSHNNTWGADSTAHRASLTLLPGEGYIITKATMLNAMLLADPMYAALVAGNPDVGIEICHNVIEAVGDIVLARHDRTVGAKLIEIALRPQPHMQNLMVRAYASGLAMNSDSLGFHLSLADAESLIRNQELGFRTMCIGYGYLLQGEEAALVANVKAQFLELAKVFLALNGLDVPPDNVIMGLLDASFLVAEQLIQFDYMNEVEATIAMVKRNMVKKVK